MPVAQKPLAVVFALVLLTLTVAYAIKGMSFSGASAGDDAGLHGGQSRFIGPGMGSVAQDEALADGHISFDEYRNAIWATFNCIAEAGYEPMTEPTPDASGRLLQYAFFSSGGDTALREVSRQCADHHSTLVAMAWAIEIRLSDDERQTARSVMNACLVAAGFAEETVTSATRPEPLIQRDAASFFTCADEVSGKLGVTGAGF